MVRATGMARPATVMVRPKVKARVLAKAVSLVRAKAVSLFQSEFQSVEYPPLTEDDKNFKEKLNDFFKSVGKSKTV